MLQIEVFIAPQIAQTASWVIFVKWKIFYKKTQGLVRLHCGRHKRYASDKKEIRIKTGYIV
jgi:hypothetical protein